ncbi:hypothetical protein BDB00DRAFT_196007 [Zychaea mexicana]|uniref:uncharacterized protein n=1 Tax=Zychaea mexicana TaxID=64656 RepID=UPI0022FEEF4E|nr:uncharacterized protein BDB00DRAFT_196007 [Zychaea mexicana]KAI9495843.1 hypothetical protein BDB00DRAFT_196007 [Zychaea mexicana]
MYLFSSGPANPVRSFNLSVIPSGQDRVVAFGPGSVLNGSVVLNLDKPVKAHSIRVAFKCEQFDESSSKTTIFNVETHVWDHSQSAEGVNELSDGSHMYLFAIKLPFVNFPPSIHGSYVNHHIEYSLQGFLELEDTPDCIETACVPVIYLPFVTCMPMDGDVPRAGAKKNQVFRRNNAVVEVTAELIKPAYCPGDLCTVKLITTNQSDCKISHMDVSLVCNVNGQRHHTLQTETFFVAIPKETKDHQSVFRFNMPDDLVPSTQHPGLDINYDVVVTMPIGGSAGTLVGADPTASSAGDAANANNTSTGGNSVWNLFGAAASHPFNNTVALPVLIATVPNGFAIPPQLSKPLKTYNEQPEDPSFIPNIESPLPSPSAAMFSPVGSWAGSPAALSPSNSLQDPEFELAMQQDASGHLMVPSSPRLDSSRSNDRRKSTGSEHSGLGVTVTVQ